MPGYKSQGLAGSGDNPQVLVRATSAAARSKGDVVFLAVSSAGLIDETIASGAAVQMVAVVSEDMASGAVGDYVVEGDVVMTVPSATYTAGHGLEVDGGQVEDSGAAATCFNQGEAGTDFGVVRVGGTTVTEITAYLAGMRFTTTT